jgi:hypothetical protein
MSTTSDARNRGNGRTMAGDENEYRSPADCLRISERTRELALKPRQDLLRKLYRLGKAIRGDLAQQPHIHISKSSEIQLLAETTGEHPDSLESCVRLTTIFTKADFERIVTQSFLSFREIVSLSYVPTAQEREELLQLAIQNKWCTNELYKEIRRRHPLPPKTIRRNPPPRSLKQARERLHNQSKRYVALLQQLFGKVEYNFATEIVDTPPAEIKPELPDQLAECIASLEEISAMTLLCAQDLKSATGYATGAVAAQNAQSARQTENAFAFQGDLIQQTRVQGG